jgi:hypothetical protein
VVECTIVRSGAMYTQVNACTTWSATIRYNYRACLLRTYYCGGDLPSRQCVVWPTTSYAAPSASGSGDMNDTSRYECLGIEALCFHQVLRLLLHSSKNPTPSVTSSRRKEGFHRGWMELELRWMIVSGRSINNASHACGQRRRIGDAARECRDGRWDGITPPFPPPPSNSLPLRRHMHCMHAELRRSRRRPARRRESAIS